MDRFSLYIPKTYEGDIETFVSLNGKSSSRTICNMVEQFNNANIRLHIPTIRKILQKNPDQVQILRSLLAEFV